jgi:hypothetical protein
VQCPRISRAANLPLSAPPKNIEVSLGTAVTFL